MIFQQLGFAQVATQIDLSRFFSGQNKLPAAIDKMRLPYLRYFSYDDSNNHFNLILDKGDLKNTPAPELNQQGSETFKYFLVGISLPNESFWVKNR